MEVEQFQVRLMQLWRRSIQRSYPVRLSLVHRNQGWTLIEMAVVAVIAGILAALAMPSMMGMKARSDLKSSHSKVKSALQEAQRSAMKRGSSCTVTFTTTNSGSANELTTINATSGCLVTSGDDDNSSEIKLKKDKSGITLTQNFGGNNIKFSYKGTITVADAGTIILSSSNTSDQKCIVLSAPLGIIRSGDYISGSCKNTF